MHRHRCPAEGNRIVSKAQGKVQTDLNDDRGSYLNDLNHVYNAVRYMAESYCLKIALITGDIGEAMEEAKKIKKKRNETY
jgi:hypothetical protein